MAYASPLMGGAPRAGYGAQRSRPTAQAAPAARSPDGFIPGDPSTDPTDMDTLLRQAGRGGVFSPGGSSALRNQAMRLWAGRRRRAGGLGRLLGLDPMQQRGAMMQAEIAGGDDMANLLGEGQMRQQDFLRQLLGQRYGYLYDERSRNQQYAQDRQMQRGQNKAATMGAIGGAVGTLGSAAIPGLLPAKKAAGK